MRLLYGFAVLVLATPAGANDSGVASFERPLVKIAAAQFNVAGFIISQQEFTFTPCGEYLMTTNTPRGLHLAMVVNLSSDPAAPKYYVPIYNPKDFRVLIDSAKLVPTVQVIAKENKQMEIVLRISADDYRTCPYLVRLRK